jgi:hypothetical protein
MKKNNLSLLLFTLLISSCVDGTKRAPVTNTLIFRTPAIDIPKVVSQNQFPQHASYELTLDVGVNDASQNIVSFQNYPELIERITSQQDQFHDEPEFISLTLPQGVANYVIGIDVRILDCGYPIIGQSISNPEKGAKVRYRHFSPMVRVPNNYTFNENTQNVQVYGLVQCP